MTKKQCTKCKEWKEVNTDNFYKDKSMKDGFRGQCKKCNMAYAMVYRKENKEKIAAACKKWQEKNKDRCIECGKLISPTAMRCKPRLGILTSDKCKEKKDARWYE